MNKSSIVTVKPFGPSIAKTTIPEKIITELNNYIDQTIKDKNKSKELDHGENLVGNVKQEFKLEKEFMKKSGWGDFLANSVREWIYQFNKKQITKFNLHNSWVVRQFKDEYNPSHFHSGHVSGVGYLKVPNELGKTIQLDKKVNCNGMLELIHGSKMFLCDSQFRITPSVGDFYFFPHYLMHTVYPFSNSNEERRSISFNASIDENIFNITND